MTGDLSANGRQLGTYGPGISEDQTWKPTLELGDLRVGTLAWNDSLLHRTGAYLK